WHDTRTSTLGRSLGTDVENLADHRIASHGLGDSRRSVMLYFVLKYFHIIGACVLLGTGAGIAFFMLAAHLEGKPIVIAGVARIVVIADFIFTATAVVVQAVTGSLLILNVGYSFWDGWIVWSIMLYVLTGALWLPVVW